MDTSSLELVISQVAITIQNDPEQKKKFAQDPTAFKAAFNLKGLSQKDFVDRVNATIKRNEELEVNASQSTAEVSKLDPEALENTGHNFGSLPGQNNYAGACLSTMACGTFAYSTRATYGSSGSAGSRASVASTGTVGSVASCVGRTTNLSRAGTVGTMGCLPRGTITNRSGTMGTFACFGGTTTNLTPSRPYGTVASYARQQIIPFRPTGSTASVATYGNTIIPARPITTGTSYRLTNNPGPTVATAGTTIRGTVSRYSGGACFATRLCLAASVKPLTTPACFGTAMTISGSMGSRGMATVGSLATLSGNVAQPGGSRGENGITKQYAKAKACLTLKSINYAGDPVGDNFELRIQVGRSEPPFTWNGKMVHGKRKPLNKDVFDGAFKYEVSPDSIRLPLTITLKELDRIDRLHDKTVLEAFIELPLEPMAGEVTKQSVELKLTEIDEKPGDVPSEGEFSFSFWCEQAV